MFRILFLTLLMVAAGAAHAQTKASRTLSAPSHRNVAYLTQEVRLEGQIALNGRIAPLTVSSSGFGVDKLATRLGGFPVHPLPVISLANPVEQNVALAEAVKWAQDKVPSFRTGVGRWLGSQGLSNAYFSYTQEINVSTEFGPKKRAISFTMTVDPNGRAIYGNPKIVDPDPTILEAVYVPLRAVEGLPSTWQYPYAGKIRYRILNKKFEPLTEWKEKDTGGAFDEETEGETPDSEKKLKCLMDLGYAGCTGPTDIKSLMSSTGSSFAIVDYVRKLEPVYEEDAAGDLVAKGAISVDARIWDCTSYINKGYFGFKLTMRAERYVTKATGALLTWDLLAQFGTTGISPSEPYTKSVLVSALNGKHPDGYILNPYPDQNELWARSNTALMKDVIYVAPVTADGGDGVLSGAAFAGDMAVTELSSVGGTREYYIGTVGDDYWGDGSYPRTVTFNIDSPQSLEEMSIIEEGYDDWYLIAVNGTMLFNGPRGGDMLKLGEPGVSEDNCTYSGAGYTCTKKENLGTPTYDKNTRTYVCPAGSVEEGSQWGWGGDDGGPSWGCYKTTSNHYSYCQSLGNWDSSSTSYICGNGCPEGMVQYMSNANGYNGCGARELSKSRVVHNVIDIRPYLKHGQNTLFLHTIVGGEGEGWVKIRSKACGATLKLDITDPPPPPDGASSGGVSDTLKDGMTTAP